MYEIWRRCYPQWDENICEEWEIEPFKTLAQANEFIKELETCYNDEGWRGHYLYKAHFYAERKGG